MTLFISSEWVDAGSSIDSYSAATMADLTIKVGDSTLTAHVNEASKTKRESVTVPLYPIAEWLVAWWYSLRFEYGTERGTAIDDEGYFVRHDLAHAASGFAYPSIVFQPTGDHAEIRSGFLPRTFSPIRYLTSDRPSHRVPISEVESEFTNLINAVVDRLDQCGIDSSTLRSDWAAIASLKQAERTFSINAGRLGLDPFDMSDRDADAIERLMTDSPAAMHEDLFSLGQADELNATWEAIRASECSLKAVEIGSRWREFSRSEFSLPPATTAWDGGYLAARRVREGLGLNGRPVAFDRDLTIEAATLESPSQRLVGIVDDASPRCVVRGTAMKTRRFAIARSIADFLLRQHNSESLLTNMFTDRQAATRAFAAEFLAPASGLRHRLEGRCEHGVPEEVVVELAEEYDVSTYVIAHQIRNHELASCGD